MIVADFVVASAIWWLAIAVYRLNSKAERIASALEKLAGTQDPT